MNCYTVKIAFWLYAYDGFTVDAASDEEAIAKARTIALQQMEATAPPEHIHFDERREGVIAYIDHITEAEHRVVAENVEFDDDRIHPPSPSS